MEKFKNLALMRFMHTVSHVSVPIVVKIGEEEVTKMMLHTLQK